MKQSEQEIINDTVEGIKEEVELRIYELMRAIKRDKTLEGYQSNKEADLISLKTYEKILDNLNGLIKE